MFPVLKKFWFWFGKNLFLEISRMLKKSWKILRIGDFSCDHPTLTAKHYYICLFLFLFYFLFYKIYQEEKKKCAR